MSDLDDILDLLRPVPGTVRMEGLDSPEPDLTPSRSDNFFHGTTEHLNPGDTVRAVADMTPEEKQAVQARGRGQNNTDRAWATVDPEEARTYGENVYQVEPLGEKVGLHRTGHVSSQAGLRVIRRHS